MSENCHVEPQYRKVAAEESRRRDVAVLMIEGMGCPTCAARVHNGLTALYGVTNATVSHVTGQAQVMFNPDLVDHPALIEAVAAAGNDGKHIYRATLAGGQ